MANLKTISDNFDSWTTERQVLKALPKPDNFRYFKKYHDAKGTECVNSVEYYWHDDEYMLYITCKYDEQSDSYLVDTISCTSCTHLAPDDNSLVKVGEIYEIERLGINRSPAYLISGIKHVGHNTFIGVKQVYSDISKTDYKTMDTIMWWNVDLIGAINPYGTGMKYINESNEIKSQLSKDMDEARKKFKYMNDGSFAIPEEEKDKNFSGTFRMVLGEYLIPGKKYNWSLENDSKEYIFCNYSLSENDIDILATDIDSPNMDNPEYKFSLKKVNKISELNS